MKRKNVRGPGGKLALWAFWLFCAYFLWNIVQNLWAITRTSVSPAGLLQESGTAEPAQWLLALLSLLTFSAVGLMLGGIAWYTRPRETDA